MRRDEASKWYLFLLEHYPSVGVRGVFVSGRGFRVIFDNGELPLQKFQKRFSREKKEMAEANGKK
jgi:hypothetical protein